MAYPYPTQVEAPPAVSSITTTAGTFPVTNGIFTDSSNADATLLASGTNPCICSTNVSNGTCSVVVPKNLSSITINTHVYNTISTSGPYNILTGVSATDATALCGGVNCGYGEGYGLGSVFNIINAPAAS